MIFNSPSFGLFLLAVFLVFWFVLNRRGWVTARNVFLLAVSYLFYGAWDWRFLSLIIVSSLVDFVVGLGIDRAETAKKKRRLLIVSLVVNLGMLAAFKYFGFFIESAQAFAATLGWEGERLRLDWILPVGISFYTFQTLSYTLDIYRGRIKSTTDPIAFFTFVAFFPQLVAGPIERARHLLPQFQDVPAFDSKAVRSGLLLVLWGLFKKVAIADRLALFVNYGYAHTDALDSGTALMIWVFFAWQIYLDFSAYSDIAIGAARMIGFRLTKNFNRPMFPLGLTEFWKRWHITLTRWFREYLYIPIRKNGNRSWWPSFAMFMVFFATGFWHGASWNFIFWGVYCGLGMLFLEPLMIKHVLNGKWPGRQLIMRIYSFVFMYTGLIWFRAPDWTTAMEVLQAFNRGFSGWEAADWGFAPGELRLAWFSLAFIFCMDHFVDQKPHLETAFYEGPGLKRWAVAWLLFIGLILMGSYGVNIQDESFIYFQF